MDSNTPAPTNEPQPTEAAPAPKEVDQSAPTPANNSVPGNPESEPQTMMMVAVAAVVIAIVLVLFVIYQTL